MCNARAIAVLLVLPIFALRAGAQQTAEYRAKLDSLAALRTVAPAKARQVGPRAAPAALSAIPRDSIQVGPYIVRAESAYVAIGRATAEGLAPRVERAFGPFASRLARHQFVIRASGGSHAGADLLTGVADSTGTIELRSSDYIAVAALEQSWMRKTEEVLTDEAGPETRAWLGGVLPMDSSTHLTLERAHATLLLSGSDGAHRCATGDDHMCLEVLGLAPVDDPAFTFFNARQRRLLVMGQSAALRRADAARYDHCAIDGETATCDSLAREIPTDALPAAAPFELRQSLVRFAREVGGDGAYARLIAASSPRERTEAAARMPADSLVKRWRTALMSIQTRSTAMDGATAASALFWAGLCACLALRSSRWR
jgi:hypothetical protein